MSKLKQSGDTLIEVLLAIAILSSVLAGSYSITRKSLRIAQASQDRIYGLKLLEGQVEMLRRYREIDSSGWVAGLNTVLPAATDSYCFNPNDLLADAGSFKPHSQAPEKCESFGPPEEPSRYKVINTRDATIPTSPVYVFRVEWLSVGGGEEVLVGGTPRFKDKVEYRYKLNAL